VAERLVRQNDFIRESEADYDNASGVRQTVIDVLNGFKRNSELLEGLLERFGDLEQYTTLGLYDLMYRALNQVEDEYERNEEKDQATNRVRNIRLENRYKKFGDKINELMSRKK